MLANPAVIKKPYNQHFNSTDYMVVFDKKNQNLFSYFFFVNFVIAGKFTPPVIRAPFTATPELTSIW